MTVSELRTLVDNLDEYIHIPGGIDRLKKMVLHLAVSGQLVPQDPSEGSGEELYREIQAEKATLIASGKLRKQKPLPEISNNNIPFTIPKSWRWAQLGEVAEYKKGPFGSALTKSMFIPKSPGAIKVYEQKNAIQKDESLGSYYITRDYYDSRMSGFAVKPDDIIVSCAGTIGEMYVIPDGSEEGIINQALMRVRLSNLTDMQFYLICLDMALSANMDKAMGSAIKNIPPFAVLKNITIPLPPLAEQKRIVAKVDSVFALIDQLAEVYKSEQTERSKLVASSLAQLAKAENDVEDSLALTHLSEIIRTKADAKVLRQTILHLAVSGQLVPQDPSEGTGEELYRQIQAEKLDLIKQGKIKKQKTLSEISEDEVPFVIPENWKWVRFPEIYNSITPVTKLKTTEYLDSGKYPIIDQGQRYIAGYTNNGELNIVTTPVTIFGDHTREIKLIDFDFIVGADGVKILEPILVNSSFFYTLVDVFRPQSRGYGRHFKMLNDKIVPLPPLDEQKRIVAKTTQILDLVVELERQLEK